MFLGDVLIDQCFMGLELFLIVFIMILYFSMLLYAFCPVDHRYHVTNDFRN